MSGRNGKIRTILLRPEQDEALNRLCEETGVNRNQLVRLVAEVMTSADVDELMARVPDGHQL